MNKVLLERVDWIERAFIDGQLTTKEVKYLLDEIDVLMDAKELEVKWERALRNYNIPAPCLH